jgi:hypothetical protein
MKKGMLVALVAASAVLFSNFALAQGTAATQHKAATTTTAPAKSNDNMGSTKMAKKHKAHKKAHKHAAKKAEAAPAK